jgi:hypothetical protein
MMKNMPSRLVLGFLAAAFLLSFSSRAEAAPIDLLRQAYVNLSEADHDYKGHRADAMKQIEEAAKLLGVKLKGDGKDREKQGVSDDHLRVADNLLNEAKGGLSGKPLAHVLKAEKQISVALKIK